MDARLRRRLEMAVRVRDFLRAHRTAGVAEGAALARLEELVQRAEDLAGQQRAGILAARAATEMRAEVRRALRSKLLLYLSAVGRVAANENAELGAQFRLPRVGPNQPFVTMARGMLEKASALVKRKDLLFVVQQILRACGAQDDNAWRLFRKKREKREIPRWGYGFRSDRSSATASNH